VRTPANTPPRLRLPASASLKLAARPSRQAEATYSARALACLPLSVSALPALPFVTASCAVQWTPSKPSSMPRSGVVMLMPGTWRTNAVSSSSRSPYGR
jgi:hypothetical protein